MITSRVASPTENVARSPSAIAAARSAGGDAVDPLAVEAIEVRAQLGVGARRLLGLGRNRGLDERRLTQVVQRTARLGALPVQLPVPRAGVALLAELHVHPLAARPGAAQEHVREAPAVQRDRGLER